jgi:RNA polymerase primary sigma factor
MENKPEYTLSHASFIDDIADALHTLDDHELKIIAYRTGLKDGARRNVYEVGSEFNISAEQVSEMELNALRKLCHPTRTRRIRKIFEILSQEKVVRTFNV